MQTLFDQEQRVFFQGLTVALGIPGKSLEQVAGNVTDNQISHIKVITSVESFSRCFSFTIRKTFKIVNNDGPITRI
jgi:hypothetical protein